MEADYDVIVIGSGAGGLLAAARAAEAGLSVAVLEKANRYGGTSATSGGAMWTPNHGLKPGADDSDSREKALAYLAGVCTGDFRQDRVEAFVDNAPLMARFMVDTGVKLEVFPYPDYFPDVPGASDQRAVLPVEIDGAVLGDDLFEMRQPPFVFKLLNRYSLDLAQAFALSIRPPGWQWTAFKMLARYWLDVPWRRRTKRDRRATMGNALVGGLRRALRDRGVPVLLNTALETLVAENGSVTGVVARRNGTAVTFRTRHGVILAAGGFEQNQTLRDDYLPVTTDARWSLTPKGFNTGDGLRAALAIGADTESMACAWWAPSMQLPSIEHPNIDVTHQMFFDHRHPHSVCVNRLGKRFVNEATSYDLFGIAMIEDQKKTGANVPCWMIFDADYRDKYTAGGIMPTPAMKDRQIPQDWWNRYIYRAPTLAELARLIDLDPAAVEATVGRMNDFARTGVDPEFGRGGNSYDTYFGDSRMKPNPCMGPINRAPYYAIRIDLGDLGSKGGLKADARARVMRKDGSTIEGLYAIGNSAGSPFGDCYPGAGGTLGPATVFGYVAATDIAERAAAAASELGQYTHNQAAR